ncbi:hypothetical protein ACH4D4_30275 [Streptomyces pristinaespiralis]
MIAAGGGLQKVVGGDEEGAAAGFGAQDVSEGGPDAGGCGESI